jgi:hypothetical protein
MRLTLKTVAGPCLVVVLLGALLLGVSMAGSTPRTASAASITLTQTVRPTSDAALRSGTWSGTDKSHLYANLDEDPANDSDAAWSTSTLLTRYQMFAFPAFGLPSGATVTKLTVYYRCKSAGVSSARAGLRVGGTLYTTTDPGVHPSAAYRTYSRDFPLNPKTGAAWTVKDINGVGTKALQNIGIVTTDNTPTVYWSQLYAVVTYQTSSPTTSTSTTTSTTNPVADFTIVALPDTQYYTNSPSNSAIFSAQTKWIVQNRASRNIVFVTGLGDIVQDGDSTASEWQVADNAYGALEDPVSTSLAQGIPYSAAVGNHDQSPNGAGSDASTGLFNQFFGISRFSGRSYYGGHYGSDNDNNYELFSAGTIDFIIINLEYDTTPEQQVLDWADGLLTTYASRRAIITTHYLINTGNPGSWSSQGQAIYNALSDHPNLFLMLGGHVSGEGRRQDTAVGGNVVYSLLSDFQSDANGGDGWLRVMTFSPANDTIRIQTFSPTRNGGSGEFQTDADSQFTLNYDM